MKNIVLQTFIKLIVNIFKMHLFFKIPCFSERIRRLKERERDRENC